MHFWWLQDFPKICVFPWENAYVCIFFGWLQKTLTCPRLSKSTFRWICIFDGSKIFQTCILPWENAYFHLFVKYMPKFRQNRIFCGQPKSKNIFIFLWKNANFKKILEPSKMHNSMKTLVFGQNQRNMEYAFSAASRKAKNECIFPWKNANFWKILEPSKMHIQRNVDLDNRGQVSVFCSQPKNIQTYAFSHGKKHILGKSWSHQKCILKMHIFCVLSKMHIENAYFLRAIFTAIQKCILDSGRPTFLICTVSPKAVQQSFVCGGNPCSEGLSSHVQFSSSFQFTSRGTRHPWPTVCNEATVLDGISGLITLTYLQLVTMFFHYPSFLMTFRLLFCHMHEELEKSEPVTHLSVFTHFCDFCPIWTKTAFLNYACKQHNQFRYPFGNKKTHRRDTVFQACVCVCKCVCV